MVRNTKSLSLLTWSLGSTPIIDINCHFDEIYLSGEIATATINISLPENLKTKVEETIATEGFLAAQANFSAQREYQKQRQERKLEALILEGLNSGEAAPFTLKKRF